jgi:4-hydroxy-2-oxoheptanedioate aldolase
MEHPANAFKAAINAGKARGILVGEADGKRYIDMGYLFVAVGSDLVMLARGADAVAARFREA